MDEEVCIPIEDPLEIIVEGGLLTETTTVPLDTTIQGNHGNQSQSIGQGSDLDQLAQQVFYTGQDSLTVDSQAYQSESWLPQSESLRSLKETSKRLKDSQKKRQLRLDSEFRKKEADKAKVRMSNKRNDPVFREMERQRDRERRAASRRNKEVRERERARDREYKRHQRLKYGRILYPQQIVEYAGSDTICDSVVSTANVEEGMEISAIADIGKVVKGVSSGQNLTFVRVGIKDVPSYDLTRVCVDQSVSASSSRKGQCGSIAGGSIGFPPSTGTVTLCQDQNGDYFRLYAQSESSPGGNSRKEEVKTDGDIIDTCASERKVKGSNCAVCAIEGFEKGDNCSSVCTSEMCIKGSNCVTIYTSERDSSSSNFNGNCTSVINEKRGSPLNCTSERVMKGDNFNDKCILEKTIGGDKSKSNFCERCNKGSNSSMNSEVIPEALKVLKAPHEISVNDKGEETYLEDNCVIEIEDKRTMLKNGLTGNEVIKITSGSTEISMGLESIVAALEEGGSTADVAMVTKE